MRRHAVQRRALLREERVDDGARAEGGARVDDRGAVRPGGEVAEHEAEAVEERRGVACAHWVSRGHADRREGAQRTSSGVRRMQRPICRPLLSRLWCVS